MMKPSLQLRIGQQLTMTPQLQQAIRLLQLPTIELQAQVLQALESNVMLEPEEDFEATWSSETAHERAGAGRGKRKSRSSRSATTGLIPTPPSPRRPGPGRATGSWSCRTNRDERCATISPGSSSSPTSLPRP